ncbi:MAG: hypothetical protein ACOYLR_09405 [Chlorobium sp.]
MKWIERLFGTGKAKNVPEKEETALATPPFDSPPTVTNETATSQQAEVILIGTNTPPIYGLAFKDKNSSLQILFNPARSSVDRIGIVIGNATFWMPAHRALALQQDLVQHQDGTNCADESVYDLTHYGIKNPVSSADVVALSRFLSKNRFVLETVARAG